MGRNPLRIWIVAGTLMAVVATARPAVAQRAWPTIFPEQRKLQIRDPSQLRSLAIPDSPAPATVTNPLDMVIEQRLLPLDESLRIALRNAQVVRVLAGVQAVSSGSTIYDPAISSTAIDQQQARFDPTFQLLNSFNRNEVPQAVFDPADPTRALITGSRTDDYNMNLNLSKTNIVGGALDFGVNTNPLRVRPGVFPLNPQNRSSVDLSYTQPLLRGAGVDANLVPIVLARIDTERSYFRLKNNVQELVRGVIEAYWAIVSARVDVWAREQQVEQAKEAYERAEAQRASGLADAAVASQAQTAFANFRANLIASRANLLHREAALRNMLGLPPADPFQLQPVTPPTTDRLQVQWESLVILAAEQRPDLIELKLILEADEQLLIQSDNNARPQLDAVALYRWNGLEGEMPIGTSLSSRPGEFTDWMLGVNFSVPIGLRRDRALLRQQELIVARDRANLEQGLHSVIHLLAIRVRNLSQFYSQYDAFREAREAARKNLDQQLARFNNGLTIFLNVLLAITDWGNAVSSEAQALAQYNTELANLEFETGTILQSHGIRFHEERFGSIGPLGRLRDDQCYPGSTRPGPNADRYPSSTQPSESFFDLTDPIKNANDPSTPSRRPPPRSLLPPPQPMPKS